MRILKSLQSALLKAGLRDNELLFYMAVLKNEGEKVCEIAKKIGIPATSGYRIFESLCSKKLLTRSGNTMIVLPLSHFIEKIDKEHRKLFMVAETLKENAKLLQFVRSKKKDEATIDVFRGDDILENYFDILYDSNWDNFVALGDLESFLKTVDWNIERKWINRRVVTGRKAKAIFSNDNDRTRELVKISSRQLRKTFLDTSISMKDKYVNLFREQIRQYYLAKMN